PRTSSARGRAEALLPCGEGTGDIRQSWWTGALREPRRGIASRDAGRVRAMKVDGGLGGADFGSVITSAQAQEEIGYDGLWSAETGHDPFFPLLIAAEHTERIELGTGIAVAFARNPMTLAGIGHDLQAYSKGRFILGLGSQIKAHIEKRFSMPW